MLDVKLLQMDLATAMSGGVKRKENQIEKAENQENQDLKPIEVGAEVVLQNPVSKNWREFGQVIDFLPDRRRSYIIKTRDGIVRKRNRRFIREVAVEEFPDSSSEDESPEDDGPRRSARLAAKARPMSTF